MNILLIDDNKQILDLLGFTVERLGFSYQKFTNPECAVEAYISGDFDLVVTDCDMPVMNGMDVIKAVRANNPLAIVIMVSGKDSINFLQEKICDLPNLFFPKPLDIKRFIDTLSGFENQLNRGAAHKATHQ